MNILVADDEVISNRLLCRVLQDWGHKTISVPDGIKALEILESYDPPDLAILDWTMPGMDGPEVCRRARMFPHGRNCVEFEGRVPASLNEI